MFWGSGSRKFKVFEIIVGIVKCIEYLEILFFEAMYFWFFVILITYFFSVIRTYWEGIGGWGCCLRIGRIWVGWVL